MKNPFTKLTTDDIAKMVAPGPISAPEIRDAAPVLSTKPPSDTVVGSVVVMLDKSYQSYLTQRTRLQAELEAKQEQLRQTESIINALEAAMTTLALDPALTTEEANIAGAPLDKAAVGAIDADG